MYLDPEYICSRCKLGEQRVFYVVWRWKDFCDSEATGKRPITSGYAASVDEAEDLMTAAAPAPETLIKRSTGYAASYHSRLAREKRKQRPLSKDQHCGPVEYVYEDGGYSEEGVRYTPTRYRIIRRTRKKVFISLHPDGIGMSEERTRALDRAQLEQTGEASAGRGTGRTTYYVSVAAWE